MSIYGLRVRDSAGNITLDSGFELTIERYTNIATGNGEVILSDISGRRTALFSFLLNPTYNVVPYSVTLSGTTFTWSAGDWWWGPGLSLGASVVGVIYC